MQRWHETTHWAHFLSSCNSVVAAHEQFIPILLLGVQKRGQHWEVLGRHKTHPII